jgi:hypothetical protein
MHVQSGVPPQEGSMGSQEKIGPSWAVLTMQASPSGQSSQLGTEPQASAGTHGPQQLSTTEGRVLDGHSGGVSSHATSCGLQANGTNSQLPNPQRTSRLIRPFASHVGAKHSSRPHGGIGSSTWIAAQWQQSLMSRQSSSASHMVLLPPSVVGPTDADPSESPRDPLPEPPAATPSSEHASAENTHKQAIARFISRA